MGSIIYIAESEAVKKYCPFSMGNIPTKGCKGKECMAWEPKPIHEVKFIAGSPFQFIKDYSKTEGYCKLIEKNGN